MSLRSRVIGLIGLVLLVSIVAYTFVAWSAARADLADELEAALRGGQQTVHSAFEDLPRSDHAARDLHQLVGTFDGNRHIQAVVRDRLQRVLFSSRVAMPRVPAPRWFRAALVPDLEPTNFAVPNAGGQMLSLAARPESDVASLWATTVYGACVFVIAVLFCATLIYWVIGRALAPLADLSRAMGAIGAGGDQEGVREDGPPELLSLQRGFNAMAQRLRDADSRNRALEAQLLTIQDEERAEIARDLHDEIGPHLFAVALDAEMIGRGVNERRFDQLGEQVRSIQGAVSYMQRQVRDLIARLRPTRAAELGLEAAIADLIAFWQSRRPGVVFKISLVGADSFVREALRDVMYRVVQEAIANALRHADTSQLTISIEEDGAGASVSVSNIGTAHAWKVATPGLGLAGMRERVQAAGGVLRIDRGDAGWTVAARFGAMSDGSSVR